jgi:tetratricopeptide (TPR) repeat protein
MFQLSALAELPTMKRAISILLLLLVVSCRQSPQQYVAKGNTYYDAGQYGDAIINYKKAIQRNPKFGEGYYRLGLAELKTGKGRDAYAALNTASTLLPDRADIKITLADLLLLGYLGDKNRPAALYTQLTRLSDDLIARDPNSYDGFRIKGAIAWTDGRLKEAEEFFQKANVRKPLQPGLILMWVQVLFRDGQSADGERLALELIQAHKEAGPIYDVLYTHYKSQNRLGDAENILRAKVANNLSNISYALELAMFYAATAKRDQITATLQRVLDDPKTFPEARLKVGDFFGALHDWPEALRQYQEGANTNPKERITYLKHIANSWLAQGKADQAAGVVAEILKERPNDDDAKAVNASLLLKTGQPGNVQAAVKDLQDLVKKQPDNALMQFTLGRALLAKGDQDEAFAQFRESLKKRPGYLPSILVLSELSLSKKDYSQALQYADSALAVNPRLTEVRLVRTATLLATQKYSQARAELTALTADVPQNIEVQFQLASLDLVEKKYPQAEARFQQLYEKDRFRALAGLVETYRLQGQLDKALSRLKVELGKAPNTPAIRFLLADTALRASKYDLALQQYQQLQIMLPRSAQVQIRLGTVYQLKGDLSKAIASFEQAQELAPRDPLVAGDLADALRMAGRTEEAMLSYRRLLALDSDNATAMNNLAYALLDTGGAPDEVQKLVERALQKAPRNPNFADTLGMLYLKKNLDDSALQVFIGLTKRFPDNPVFRYHYALTLTHKGQKAKAKTELEVALRKSPPDELRKSIQSSLAKIQQ